MFFGTTSIQFWTLLVATLAVIASVAGTIINSRLSASSEHKIWQRELRVKIYASMAVASDEFIEVIERTPEPSPGEIKAASDLVFKRLADISTYGSDDVYIAALNTMKAFLRVRVYGNDADSQKKAVDALNNYRKVVRHSLRISQK